MRNYLGQSRLDLVLKYLILPNIFDLRRLTSPNQRYYVKPNEVINNVLSVNYWTVTESLRIKALEGTSN